jgi:hypothetical protein
MPGGYYTMGKQVLWGIGHIADAKDPDTATMIADALNGHPEALPDHSPIMREIASPVGTGCRAYQASDQMICPCGLQWDVNDNDPPACKNG